MLPNNTTQEVLVMCSSLSTQMHMTARFVYNASAYVMEFIGLHEDGTTLRIKPINVSGGLIVTVLAININDKF